MEAPQESTTLSAFTCFPSLAPEIRLNIWCLMVLEPRILELDLDEEDGLWHSPTPCSAIIPSSLHTCHESRQEALKIYQQMTFGAWINFSVDIIYVRVFMNNNWADIEFQREFLELLQTDPAFKKLHFLALWSDTWQEYHKTHNRYKILEALPKLVELSIISDDDGLFLDEEGEGFSYWNEGSEVIFEDHPEYSTMPDDEKRTQDSERRYGPQAGWIAEDPYPDRHYLSHDPPEFKFRAVRRDRPAGDEDSILIRLVSPTNL